MPDKARLPWKQGRVTFCVFLGEDTPSVETTISMGQNMQMCHSLRCKQIDMSTADDLKSISQRMPAAHARITESKLVGRLKV